MFHFEETLRLSDKQTKQTDALSAKLSNPQNISLVVYSRLLWLLLFTPSPDF